MIVTKDNVTINDFNRVCRTCLSSQNLEMIYKVINSIPIEHILNKYTQVKVNSTDNLPKQVCSDCIKNLNSAYTFLNNCELVNQALIKCSTSIYEESNFQMRYSEPNDNATVFIKCEIKEEPQESPIILQDYPSSSSVDHSASQMINSIKADPLHTAVEINDEFQDHFGDLQKYAENTVEKVIWLEPATKLLVTLVEECRPKVGKSIKFRTKKKMWEYIAKVMDENHGHRYSPLQVENKFKSLERKYKNKIQHNKKTGNDRAACALEKELDNVFKSKDHIFPQYLLGTQHDGIARQQSQEKFGIKIDEEVGQADELVGTILNEVEAVVVENQPVEKIKEDPNQSIVRELRSLRKDKNIYYEKKLDFKKKQLLAYEARTKEIERNNILLAELIKTLGHK